MDPIPGVGTLHAREVWQDPRYPVFGPPDLAFDNDTVVIHYTAADDLIDGDPGEHAEDLPAYMRAMQYSYVTNRGYSLGYLFAVDWLGGVWQIRGWEFQSAANAGHNTHTWPILMLVDGDDEATPEAAASVRALVAEAERRAGMPQKIMGHGQLKIETGVGTATACPGAGLLRQIKAGVFVPTGDEGNEEEVAKPTLIKYATHPAVYAQWAGFKTWIPDEGTLNAYKLVYGVEVQTVPAGYTGLLAASGPIVGPIPGGVDGWGRPV